MHVSDLDYTLPQELIAHYPSDKRDESRLLVFDRKSGKITHSRFNKILDFLNDKYIFIRNDASTIRARIFANRNSGGKVECLLLSPIEKNIWKCMIKPAKKLSIGSLFFSEKNFKAKILQKFNDGQALVEFFDMPYASVLEMSENVGVVPLPPYIQRNQREESYDKNFDNLRYETVYADSKKKVAAAAPTAGLHFSEELVKKISNAGHTFKNLTLHVGIGTFQPIKTQQIESHLMHTELYEIPFDTANALMKKDKKILCVGTTSLRASEDFCRKNLFDKTEKSFLGSANLFVHPPQKVISADALITNFHLPKSTLMCLVSAFIKDGDLSGINTLKEIYAEAIKEKYRFFSYGDAMLIL